MLNSGEDACRSAFPFALAQATKVAFIQFNDAVEDFILDQRQLRSIGTRRVSVVGILANADLRASISGPLALRPLDL